MTNFYQVFKFILHLPAGTGCHFESVLQEFSTATQLILNNKALQIDVASYIKADVC